MGVGFAALREWGLDGVRWGLGHVRWGEGCFWGDWVWGVLCALLCCSGMPLRSGDVGLPPPCRPGHAPACLLRSHASPFVGDERGRACLRGGGVGVCRRSAPGIPRSLRFAPPYAGAKGAYAHPLPSPLPSRERGISWRMDGGNVFAVFCPAPPPRASPARCARRPLTLERRGLVDGCLRGGGVGVCRRSAPGIPRSLRFAPPYAGAKGACFVLPRWIPACAGMTGVVRRNDGGSRQG